MSIFKDTFKFGVKTQIEKRQEAIFERTPTAVQYYNARNAWIRMTSSVNVKGSDSLAKQYVLIGGVINNNGTLKSGIGNTNNNAYSTVTPGGGTNRLGIRPMPGITGIDVQSLGAYGSLRNVVVNFVCWDIRQLEDLELLYMRPGYTVLIEWGWAPYLTNNKTLGNIVKFNDSVLNGGKSKEDIWKEIFTQASADGNYDAMYGKIQNYSWKARNDGGYDCTVTVISIGEIIDSLKVNYVPADQPDIEKKGIITNRITSLQDLNLQSEISGSYSKNIVAGVCHELYAIASARITSPEGSYRIVDTIGSNSYNYDFYKLSIPFTNVDVSKTSIIKNDVQIYITLGSFIEILNKYVLIEDSKQGTSYVKLSVKESDITSDGKKDLLCLGNKYQLSTDLSVCLIANEAWLNPEGELGIKGSFNTLQTFTKNATKKYFYSDSNINNKYQFGIIGNIYVNLNYLYSLITDDNVASQDQNEKNDIPVYRFVKDILFGVSKAIGNVANFDIHVDPIDNNVAKIIDVNYIDTISRKEAYDNAFKFEMHNTKSIVRNYSLESSIFPSQGAIVAIGAQVQGGVIGADTNTLVDFNQNLTDRIIPKVNAPVKNKSLEDDIKAKIDNLTKNVNVIITFITGLDTNTSEGGGFDVSKTSEYYSALRDIINFYKGFVNVNNKNRAIIPTKLSLEIDGIGGMIIGNIFRIPDEILPKGYKGDDGIGAKIGFVVTKLGHSIQNNDWITKIDSQFIILDNPKSGIDEAAFQELQKQIITSIQSGNVEEAKKITSSAISTINPPEKGNWNTLNNTLLTIANQGSKTWKEQRSNPLILNTYKEIGIPQSSDAAAWCAAFVGYVLKTSKLPYLKTLSSLAYAKYGQEVSLNDPSKWRKWDIAVWKHTTKPGTGHVSFITGVTGTGTTPQEPISAFGGNQSDTVQVSKYPYRGSDMVLIAVRRAWIPPNNILPPASGNTGGNTI